MTPMNRLALFATIVLACRAQPVAENPPPPPPPPAPGGVDTIPIAGHALYVPHGFSVNLFAQGVNGVRYLALGPNGAVYASLTSAGQIVSWSMPTATAWPTRRLRRCLRA